MEIVPGLHCIAGVSQGVNAYVWHPRPGERTDGEPIVFDCGYPWHARSLLDCLQVLGCAPGHIRYIAVTHDDFDHTGALADVVEASGAQVIAHVAEAPSIASSGWRELPWRGDVSSVLLRMVTGVAYSARPKRPVTVSHPVEDGAQLPGGWVAIHTPGHTPGHLAFWHAATRVLIAGDALGSRLRGEIRANIGSFSVDNQQVAASVRKLSALEPETICFGHGSEIVSGAARLLNGLAASLV